MTGTAELFTLDADVNGGNVRLLTTGASTNSTQYKLTRTSTLVYMALKDFMVKAMSQMMGHPNSRRILSRSSNFIIDPATVGDDTGTVEPKVVYK